MNDPLSRGASSSKSFSAVGSTMCANDECQKSLDFPWRRAYYLNLRHYIGTFM